MAADHPKGDAYSFVAILTFLCQLDIKEDDLARYIGSVCRLCRRENLKLFLKGDRCYSDKCAFDRRSFPPGQHGQRRGRKVSDYGIQLREKQKVKRMYGLSEKQFHLFFERAEHQKGITGSNLLIMLERRLDNVIYRLGFTNSRTQGRHFVRHAHFLVNGKRVDIPSKRWHSRWRSSAPCRSAHTRTPRTSTACSQRSSGSRARRSCSVGAML